MRFSIVFNPPTLPSSRGGDWYTAGSILSGSIYVQDSSTVEQQQEHKVYGYILGKEQCRVINQDNNGEKTREGDKTIIKTDINVDAADNGVNSNKDKERRCPFRVKLPSHLPSTFYHHDGALDQRRLLDCQLLNTFEAYCKISYKVVVYCKSSDDGKIYQKVEQDINILAAPLPAEPVPNYISPITKRVNYFCCINIGSIIMGARVLNTRLAPGEDVIVDFGCQNMSTTLIDKVEVIVKEVIEWQSGHDLGHDLGSDFTIVLVQSTFKPTPRWQNIAKANDHKKEVPPDMLELIHSAIKRSENRVSLSIPSSAYSSYNGGLIKVRQRLEIKVYTSGGLNSNISMRVPLRIGQKKPKTDGGGGAPSESSPPPVLPIAVTPFLQSTVVPSLEGLIKEIQYSVSALSTVAEKVEDNNWKKTVFSVMTPQQYASLIKCVPIEFDQPDMAELVGNNVMQFTHEYIVSALNEVSDWIRIPLLTKTLPLCTDLNENGEKIMARLSDWEVVCTQSLFN